MTGEPLETQALRFAEDLTSTVQALVPGCDPFRAKVLEKLDGSEGFTVRQIPTEGITLCVDGAPLLTLRVVFQCILDRENRYLAVSDAKIKVFARGSSEPLFRYEYDRAAVEDMPAAHIQIHAHRDAISHVMANAGESTARARRRARQRQVGQLQDLHFPVGGHRFRPCLEDVLEMLVVEFGVDSTPEGRSRLRDGRASWRRTQVGAVVRDAPEEAVRVLESMGYVVHPGPQAASLSINEDRLRDF